MSKPSTNERYSRQVLFEPIGIDGQKRLGEADVALIGCGALGTVIADRLARAGVGRLKIIDRDFVELDNLQRQTLFDEEHARSKLPKAVAAARALEEVNSEIEIEADVLDVKPSNIEEILGGCDLAMDATDNLETRFLLNDACLKLGVPWVHGAAVGSCGQEMPVMPGQSACFRCFLVESPGPIPGCDALGVLSPITGMIGELQSAHALRILTGHRVRGGLLTYIDVWETEFLQFTVDRREDCPACGQRDFSFLNKETTSWSTTLCGRNAVQIAPAGEMQIDLAVLQDDLAKVGSVEANGYLLVFRTDGYEMTVFPDARAIIKGTTEERVARSLYSRYLGM